MLRYYYFLLLFIVNNLKKRLHIIIKMFTIKKISTSFKPNACDGDRKLQ